MSVLRPVLFLALLLPLARPALARQATVEYEVKAAFVLNFSRYVEWPPPRQSPPLRICMFRENPFGDRLEAVVSGERWAGGAIELRLAQDEHTARECHLLYVPAAETERFLAMAPHLATTPVLTVGETRPFLDGGGMIQLFIDANRVRFSINQRSALQAGLQISSRLLRLARTVIGESTHR